MSRLDGNMCPFIQKFKESSGTEPSIAVISKKHNKHKPVVGQSSPMAIKRLDIESLSCEKIKKYFEEGRLVVISQKDGQRFIHMYNMKNLGDNVPNFIRYVDKSTLEDSVTVSKDLLSVIVEEISEEDYSEFYAFCLENATNTVQSSATNTKDEQQVTPNSVESQIFREMEKDHLFQALLSQASEILRNMFALEQEIRQEESNRNKEADKKYRQKQEDIRYEQTKTRIRKNQEQKIIDKNEAVEHIISSTKKKESLENHLGVKPIIGHVS